MDLPKELNCKLEQLYNICKKYDVVSLYVFGSAINGNFNPKTSDIDLIIELDDSDPVAKGEKLMKIWTEAEELFGRKVDLLTNKKIKNPFLQREIERSKQLLYDRAS
jgi:predicted nucleotidyltransferase